MPQQSLFALVPKASDLPTLPGKDEMNLAEFPLTKLGSRDTRDVLEFTTYALDQQKRAYQQQWIVRGATGLGLPNELGDRVIPALISLNAQQKFVTRKVYFSKYQLLRLMKLDPTGQNSDQLELALKQLAGITIESKRAFYDKEKQKRLTSLKAFHLIEKLWFRKDEAEDDDSQHQTAHGYVVWGEEIWKSLCTGYIKNLDLDFYYSLSTPLARRLYRFLDKRMYHTKTLELDVFELTGRLGMTPYSKPSAALRKVQPAIEQLVERKFLNVFAMVKKGKYTRVKLTKATAEQQARQLEQEQTRTQAHEQYQTTTHELTIWQQVVAQVQANITPAQKGLLDNLTLLALNAETATLGAGNGFMIQLLERPTQAQFKAALITALTQYSASQQPLHLVFINLKTATTAA